MAVLTETFEELVIPNSVMPRQVALPGIIYVQDLYLRANKSLGGLKMTLGTGVAMGILKRERLLDRGIRVDDSSVEGEPRRPKKEEKTSQDQWHLPEKIQRFFFYYAGCLGGQGIMSFSL